MITEIYVPKYPLNLFVDHFFYYSGVNASHIVERFLPDAEVQLIFDLTDKPKFIYDNDTLREIQSCQKVWFSGFRTKPITIPSARENEMIIVQLKKGKAGFLLTEPLTNLTDRVVNAEIVMSREILNIRERLLGDRVSPNHKFLILEQKLLNHYHREYSGSSLVDFVISKILYSPTTNKIKSISDKTGFSHKHFIKIFKDHVGVTPKEFQKVIRFQKAIQQIEKHSIVDWSEVVHDCGFYDQSHFIEDFKSFSGFTPSDYLKRRGEYLNYVPL